MTRSRRRRTHEFDAWVGMQGMGEAAAPSYAPTAKKTAGDNTRVSGQKIGRRGRPLGAARLTPGVETRIRSMLRCGTSLEVAARTAGVSARSVRRWRARGELDLDRELAAGELQLAAVVSRSTARSWRAAAFLLERRFPERWATPQRLPAARRD